MGTDVNSPESLHFMPRSGLQNLIDVLHDHGFRCVGPRVRDGAIVYDTVESVDDLPTGYRDRQAPGEYRLEDSGDSRVFAWANGAQALKPETFAAEETLWRVERGQDGALQFNEVRPLTTPTAVIGVRACDLAGLRIQERIFQGDAYRDVYFQARRESLLLVAVNCSHPADTCFCASTGDGPEATHSYDLVLTELDDGYTLRSGSRWGEKIAQHLPLTSANDQQHFAVGRQVAHASSCQQRKMPDKQAVRRALMENLEHPRWDDVAERCLSCGNCTMVCPTCFCHREDDAPILAGDASRHVRQWDSCFTQKHSYIHGFVLRETTRQRYRQWLTHKLSTWFDQFGSSGCVGCGRCISWCPVGIDITEEAAAFLPQTETPK